MRAPWLGLFLAAITALTAAAQEVPSAVLVFDRQRVFDESQLGQELTAEIEARSIALSEENKAIEAALEAEELNLTELKKTLSEEEFQLQATEFDAKVTQARADQDQKLLALQQFQQTAQQQLEALMNAELAKRADALNASLIFERQQIYMMTAGVDITADIIAQMDALGAEAPEN